MKLKNLNMYIIVGLITLFVISGFYFLSNFKTTGNIVKEVRAESLEEKFALLSNADTNFCAGPNILDRTNADRLQGSCCGKMDFHRYSEQVEGLKKYRDIDKIPSDPYDISVSLAEELLDFQKTIIITTDQQSVYDDAVKLSHEGGPCCCKCWRWYAFEGLAKYLITEHNFNAEQIAEVWDLEDGCGGQGHAHET